MRPLLVAATLLCLPASTSAEPFEVIVPAEIELLMADATDYALFSWGWLLFTGDTLQGSDLQRVRLSHQSDDLAVSFKAELLADPSHTFRPNEAIGRGDIVMLGALAPPGVRPLESRSRWSASLRVSPPWRGECLLTTTVQFGDDRASFTTKVRVAREPDLFDLLGQRSPDSVIYLTVDPTILKAQRVRSSATSTDSEIVDTADLTWTPPDFELRTNRTALEDLRLHDLDTKNVHFRFWNSNIYDVGRLIEQMIGLPVEVDHRLRGRQITFVTHPMDLMDGMLLLAHRESLRYVADHNTLHLLPAEDQNDQR